MQPTLLTGRLSLRPTTDADLDALWELWTDPDVRRYLWDDRRISIDEAADTLADCLALAQDGLGLWMVSELETPSGAADSHHAEPIGCAGLLPVTAAADFDPRIAGLVEPLVALRPTAWGHGYAVEALLALRDHATQSLGLARLAGVTDVPNVASDRMLQRAGFRVLGECDGPCYRLRTYLYEPAAHQ